MLCFCFSLVKIGIVVFCFELRILLFCCFGVCLGLWFWGWYKIGICQELLVLRFCVFRVFLFYWIWICSYFRLFV